MLNRSAIDDYVDAHFVLACNVSKLEVHRHNRHRFGWQATLLYRYLDAVSPEGRPSPHGGCLSRIATVGLRLLRRRPSDDEWVWTDVAPKVAAAGVPLRLIVLHCCETEALEDGSEHGTWHNALIVVSETLGAATALPLSNGAERCLSQLSSSGRALLMGACDTAVLPVESVPCALLWLHVALVRGGGLWVAHTLRQRDPCGRGAHLFQMYVVERFVPDLPEGADPQLVAARLWAPHCTGAARACPRGWLVRTAEAGQYSVLP